jgi:hypothetical protein
MPQALKTIGRLPLVAVWSVWPMSGSVGSPNTPTASVTAPFRSPTDVCKLLSLRSARYLPAPRKSRRTKRFSTNKLGSCTTGSQFVGGRLMKMNVDWRPAIALKDGFKESRICTCDPTTIPQTTGIYVFGRTHGESFEALHVGCRVCHLSAVLLRKVLPTTVTLVCLKSGY